MYLYACVGSTAVTCKVQHHPQPEAVYANLGVLAVLVDEGKVILIDSPQAPVSELDEAITPPGAEVLAACRCRNVQGVWTCLTIFRKDSRNVKASSKRDVGACTMCDVCDAKAGPMGRMSTQQVAPPTGADESAARSETTGTPDVPCRIKAKLSGEGLRNFVY